MNTAMVLKLILLGLFTIGNIGCRPQKSADSEIESNEFKLLDDGAFHFKVVTSDGFSHEVNGDLENKGTEEESQVIRGRYSYMGEDKVLYEVTYVADRNGFQPYGKHLPQFVSPPPFLIFPSVSPPSTPPPTTSRPSILELPVIPIISAACSASLCGTGLG